MPREKISASCAQVSIDIYNFLQEKQIPSLIVIGDMKIDGEKEYNTTYEYLERELKGLENGNTMYHVWVVTENFLLIDNSSYLDAKQAESKFSILVSKHIKKFISKPIKNPIARRWIKKQQILKKQGK
jgi:hypothetical protein